MNLNNIFAAHSPANPLHPTHDETLKISQELAKAGLPIAFLQPGEKFPVSQVWNKLPGQNTEQQLYRIQHNALREAHRRVGDPDADRLPTPSSWGWRLATTDPEQIAQYWVQMKNAAHGTIPNIAICPWIDTRVLLVDADTDAEVNALRQFWMDSTGTELPQPTVTTPGKKNDAGEWVHRNGGHWYMEVPQSFSMPITEVSGFSVEYAGSHFDIRHAGKYVLVPPSVRAEGAYTWTGAGTCVAPQALLDKFSAEGDELVRQAEVSKARKAEAAAKKAARAQAEAAGETYVLEGSGEDLDSWQASLGGWDSILDAYGWAQTGTDTCGCPVLQHPGATSKRSATGHWEGCSENSSDTELGFGRLQVWSGSNDVLESGAYTPIQVIAAHETNGDLAEACRKHNVPGSTSAGTRSESYVDAIDSIFDAIEHTAPATSPAPAQSSPAPTSVPTTAPAMDFSKSAAAASTPTPVNTPSTQEPQNNPQAAPQDTEIVRASWDTDEDWEERQKLWAHAKSQLENNAVYPLGSPSTPDRLRNVFDYSDVTRDLFHYARAIGTSPLAKLMELLTAVGTRVPVGTEVGATQDKNDPHARWTPLSTYTVLAGRSGTTKSLAMNPNSRPEWASDEALEMIDWSSFCEADQPRYDTPSEPASGQVLTDIFQESVSMEHHGPGDTPAPSWVEDRPVNGAGRRMRLHPTTRIEHDELSTFLAVGSSSSSTLYGELLKAWTGRPLGSASKTHGDTLTMGAYSIFMIGGIQPKLAGPLLAEDGRGLPQRVVFVPTTDPWSETGSDHGINKPSVAPVLQLPQVPAADVSLPRITCGDAVIRDKMRARRYARYDSLPEDAEQGEAQSQQFAVRLRVGALFAILHGGLVITDDIWAWAGHLMDVSRATEAWMAAAVENERMEAAFKRGEELDAMDTGKRIARTTGVESAMEVAVKKLKKSGDPMTEGEIKRGVSKVQRANMQEALKALTDAGRLETTLDDRGKKVFSIATPQAQTPSINNVVQMPQKPVSTAGSSPAPSMDFLSTLSTTS